MILSFAPEANLGPASLALALVAVLAYAAAALPSAAPARWPAPALVAGWILHGVLLALDVIGLGRIEQGARLGFGPVLSLTVWLVLAVHAVESRFVPVPGVRRSLAVAGVVSVVLAWAFPGEVHKATTALEPLHWALGVASYALFGAAVLHATLLDAAERRMRQRDGGAGAPASGPMGMPLLRLERLTFRFVEIGFVVLTLAVCLGALTVTGWRWSHETVFSLLSWVVFARLLWGRLRQGWRGRRATRWLYVGAVLLLLGYAGSRFVFEVVLGRRSG
jgi:ABC-type uncharacterized transport system permease subunit